MCSVASLGVVAILFIFEVGFMIGVGGIMLCVMFGCTVGMLRVKYSSLFCAFSIFVANVAVLFDDSSYDLWYVYVNTNFFLVTLCLFGIMFSYIAELHFRQRFLDTDTIFRWSNPATTQADCQVQPERLLLTAEFPTRMQLICVENRFGVCAEFTTGRVVNHSRTDNMELKALYLSIGTN